MSFEIFFQYKGSDSSDGIMLEEYNDEYYLVSAVRPSTQGTVYKKWGYPQTKARQPAEKCRPWGICLGSPRQAVYMLHHILSQIEKQE